MKIIKYTLNTLAAIFTIGAIFTACSEKELANENEQSLDKKGYTLTIEATKAAPTKALAEAGGNIVASWAKGEKVSVFNSSQVKIGELTAQYSGVSTVLSGELNPVPAVGDVLTLEFCSASYTAQDGTLAYIAANCDYATSNVTVKTVANNTITTEAHANFVNQQAIVKFTLKNDAAQPAAINLSQLTIKVSGSASDVTVTPASAASELYVALPAVANGSIELIGTAAPKTYTYARNSVTFENGKFYPITVNMTSAVAKIGDVKYDTLAAAVAAVPTDGTKTTITMIANETMATGASITIAATQNVVLDLNGKTVTGNGGLNGANFFLLTNKGTLEITDLSSGKTGKLTGYWTSPNTGYSNQYVTVYNAGGTLTLTAGTVETTSGYLSYAINNTSNAWGVGDDKESVFNMTGGSLTASNGGDAALRVYQNCADTANPFSHNYVTISGGTIASGGIFLDNYIYHPHENTTGEGIITNVTITGGEIHGLIDMKLRHAFHTSINISGGTFLESKLRVRKVNNSDTDRWDPSIENPSSPVFNISGGNFTFVNGCAFGLNYGYNGTDWSSYLPYSVTGGTFSVDPTAYVSDGYEAVEGDNVWNVVKLPDVAEIGTTRYATLAAAVAAVPTDGTQTTIRMIANETMATGASITIAATQNVVLDLNGKTVTGNGGLNGANFFLLTNKGTLEITDLSSGKTGKLTGYWTSPNTGYSNQYVTVYNAGGTLTLTAGTVETTSGYLSYAINNTSNAWGVGDDKESVFNMTGGSLTASNGGDAALRVYQNCADTATPFSHNYVTISGGTIASGGIFLDNYIYHPHENTTGEGIITNVTITGGEIHGLIDMKLRHAFHTSINISGGTFLESKLRVRKVNNSTTDRWDPSIENPSSPVFNISGGNFTFVNGYAFGLNYEYSGTDWSSYIPFSVTGGTFSVNPTTYVAPGYAATGTGPWTVVEAPITVGTGGQYETLAEGVAAVANGGTIKLVSDINVNSSITLPRSLSLDLNGNTITSSAVLFNIYSNYNLTIKDSGENGAIDAAADKIIYSSNSGSKIKIEGGNLSIHSTSNYTYGVLISSGASFEMTGGKITVTNASTSSYNYCVSNSGNGSVTISGGELLGEASGGNYTLAISGSGNTTISNGIFTGRYSASGWGYSPYVIYNTGSGTVSISGGYFKAIGNKDIERAGHLVEGNASVSGGYFGGTYYYGLASNNIASNYAVRELTNDETNPTHAAAKAAGYKYVVEAQ